MLTNVQTSEQDSHALITVQVAVHTHVSHTVTRTRGIGVHYKAHPSRYMYMSVLRRKRGFSADRSSAMLGMIAAR